MVDFKTRYIIDADNSRAKHAFQEIDALQRKTGSGGRGSGVADVFGGNIAADAVTRLTSVLTAGGKAVFDYSQEVAGAKLAFESLMGSADAAAKHVKDLEALSRSTPLKFESIAGMSQRLQGAGVAAKDVIELITDIGNVAAATGKLTEERMDGIGLAISQVFTKGKVSAEEMNQLAEKGVPAWRILSQQLGKTTGELQKMAEKGQITADVMIRAFQDFSKQKYGDAMQKQAVVFGSAWQNIENIITQSASRMFKPATDAIAKFTADTSKSLKDQEKAFSVAGVSLGYALGEAIGKGIREWRRSPDGQDIALLFQNPRMYFAKELAAAVVGFQKGNSPPTQLPPAIDYTSPRSPGQRRPGSAIPGAVPGAIDTKAIEAQRREAERLAERDLAAAIRIEEINFKTIADVFEKEYDRLREKLRGDNNIAAFIRDINEQIKIHKGAVEASVKFLTELEDRGKSVLTVHEQALLTAEQTERKNTVNRQGEEDQKRNLEEIEEANRRIYAIHEQMGEAAIKRYEAEAKIADEVERQAAAIREQLRTLLQMPGFDENGIENVLAPVDKPGFLDGLFGEDGINIIRDEALEIQTIYNDMGQMIGGVLGQMAEGVGSLIEAWVLFGDLGPNAVRKMTASILAGLAAQAAVKAIFQLAEGFAALFFNPAEAAAHFKAAALYGAVALTAAVAGRAIAGDSFKEKGGSSSNSAGQSRQSRGDQSPISRQSENAFTSSRNPFQQAADQIEQVMTNFQKRVEAVPAGHVFMTGMKQNRGAVGRQTVEDIKSDSAIGSNLQRATGGR